jgi:CRISPR-associated endonuclease/helicase Cas3
MPIADGGRVMVSLDQLFFDAYRPQRVEPYPYQRALAESDSYDILIAPTGLGKTAAVTLGWVWKRLTSPSRTPRRLVWCLPMRSLVEQTAANAQVWISRLSQHFDAARQTRPEVHVLMGGAERTEWRLYPERAAIVVGTQDMLLSRALMRGYGMSRFGWPIDFGLLHTDSLWVFDEVQLMSAGLATSAQLDAFRRIGSGSNSHALARSLWVSATLRRDWLNTVDLVKAAPELRVLEWSSGGAVEPAALTRRLDAVKHVTRAATRLLPNAGKMQLQHYARSLAGEVLDAHRRGFRTLVIVNQVQRAQAVYRALSQAGRSEDGLLLIHSRFRPREREKTQQALALPAEDQIVVATQAVEAGVDLTSAVLFTELAPWASLVQRFGRCNRAGELNEEGGAEIRWVDAAIEDEHALSRPYETAELIAARSLVAGMDNAAPRGLPGADQGPRAKQVLRLKDFAELFDTDPDLSGYDIDISPFVRDADDTDVRLFWRDGLDKDRQYEPPRTLLIDLPPIRDELCAAPIGRVRDWLNRPRSRPIAAYVEDPNGREQWVRLDRVGARLRPGLVILLDSEVGGYDNVLGLDLDLPGPVPIEVAAVSASAEAKETAPGASTDADPLSEASRRDVALEVHLADVAGEAERVVRQLQLHDDLAAAVVRAGAWHDLGKAHEAFQARLGNADGARGLLAKSTTPLVRYAPRRYFRHELASALAFLSQHDGEPQADLIAYLIAAHHGKVRTGIRALPDEKAPPEAERRFARGVWDGDPLPPVRCGTEDSAGLELSLALMDMGEDERGRPSWAARTQALLHCYGPFLLAYLEALVRMADWRASDSEQREETPDGG